MKRDNQDEDESPESGMYYERASATFYFDQDRRKAFVDIVLGPRYGRGFSYDILSDGNAISLINEQLE